MSDETAEEPIIIKAEAYGPGMANGPSRKQLSTADVTWITGIGVELPSQEKDGKHHYIRDGAGNIGVLLDVEGLENFLPLQMTIKVGYHLMMNAYTIGRTIALLHEFAILIGAEKEMHEELDKTRAEIREIMADVDLSEYV